ncbi:MAG TPA: transglycosylase SLT domain-containing protein [Eoetvoesiella sp.]
MADIGSENLLARSARGAVHQVSEFVHVSAIYLGIAVLVTMVLGVTVPSLRSQTQQMHTALLASLRPDAFQDNLLATFAQDPENFFATDLNVTEPFILSRSPTDSDASVQRATPAPSVDANVKPSKPAPGDFNQALSAAESLAIPGVTRAQAHALRSYIARKYKIAHNVASVLIKAAFVEGTAKNLDPQLLLAVIAIESRYNPFAESHVGAQGLMQVMTRVHKEKFEFEGGPSAALNPIANIRVGTQILYDCIKRRGSVEAGLACYVGATGPSDGGYGQKVLAERRRIALASGIPVSRN